MQEEFVDVGFVRIRPSRIEFIESVYTRKYTSRFTLQNIGKTKVFVRIPATDTKDFEIEFLPRGLYLSPGLKIVKTVKLKYSKRCSRECLVCIEINEEKYDYLMLLKSSYTTISVTPKMFDFGLINAGNIHVSHTLVIENGSEKDHSFIVDLSKCSESVIIEPTKGRIKAQAFFEISIKMIGFTELNIDTQFQVKCGHQIFIVPVKGKIIISRLEAFHPNSTQNFTLLEFPSTYFGLTSEVYLFVRNYSSIAYMFAIIGEMHNRHIKISEIKKTNVDFRFFTSYPMDGVFQSNETKLFKFTFSPIGVDMERSYKKSTPFFACTILMHRFKCTPLKGENRIDLMSNVSYDKSSSYDPSLRSSETNIWDPIPSYHYLLDENAYYKYNLESVHDFLRVHLYATAQLPRVQVIPDEININDMQVKKCEFRTLQLKNTNQYLPIILKYKKSSFITVSCERFYLRPLETIEIGVKIDPATIGSIATNITFDLLYYNLPKVDNKCKVIGQVSVMVKFDVVTTTKYPTPQLNLGLTPNYIKDVGKYCHGIRFNTKLNETKCITVQNISQLDKSCKDLVAFPNDTQKSLRPFRTLDTCRTIFTKQARYIAPVESQYELQMVEVAGMNKIKNYYTNYMREQWEKRSKSMTEINAYSKEYDVTIMTKLLCDDIKLCKQPPPISYYKQNKGLYFLPLTPQEMNDILVLPPVIKTSPIGSYSSYDFTIDIINKNKVPIRVSLCSDKRNLSYSVGNKHIIGKKQEKQIKLSYRAASVGYYTSNLYLIINDSTVLSVPILADIVSRTLKINVSEIFLKSNSDHQYIEMKNIINVDVPYCWCITHPNFTIEPSSGVVMAGGTIVCVVNYDQKIEGPSTSTANLLTECVIKQTLRLSVKEPSSKLLLLTKEVNFEKLPLNEPIRDKIIIKNSHNFSVEYHIEAKDLPTGLTVFPTAGYVDPSGQVTIYVMVQFTICCKFDYTLKIHSFQSEVHKVPVYGTVVYPEVVVTPNTINFPKIPASTAVNVHFCVKNVSCALTKIRFDMSEYEEFLISENQDPWDGTEVKEFYLESRSTKSLYIHFLPKGASTYLFYLPIVLNDILGPPIYSDVMSTRTNYYLIDFYENCEILNIPKTMPCIKVRTLVTPAKINISKTLIQFTTVPAKRFAFSTITISNPQDVEEDVCIRTDDLKHPLYVKPLNENDEIFQKYAIVLYLKPNEPITFNFSFAPDLNEFGKYQVNLPVYLRSDNSFKEHNVIVFRAEYKRPAIEIIFSDLKYLLKACAEAKSRSNYVYNHATFPLSFKGRDITFQLKGANHLESCNIITKTTSDSIMLKWMVLRNTKEILDNNGTYTVDVAANFIGTENREVYLTHEVRCSCGGYWSIKSLGNIECSLLTAYLEIEHLLKADGKTIYHGISSYPLFPDKFNEYYDFANECCNCAEDWLHTQLLFGLWRYSIPDAINFPNLEPVTDETITRQTQLSRLPVLHILGNLLGSEAVAAVKTREIPMEEIEKVKVLIEIYRKVLELVKKHGATVTVLRPEFFLSLSDYFTYYKDIYDYNEYPQSQYVTVDDLDGFYRLSKQAWADLILQIYKSLYLNKLVTEYKMLATKGKLTHTPLSSFFTANHTRIRPEIYSDSESLILNWLQFHYNSNKINIFSYGHQLEDLEIDFYNNSLHDGLVFVAVVTTYCPYLINRIRDMYVPASTNEEVFHNVVRLIQCLETINYTFRITPEQIMKGNSVRLLMFSVYLFEVLPHMYPTETITIHAGLSTTTLGKMEIFNGNQFPIAYKPIFIGCDDDTFTTEKEIFQVPKQRRMSINIKYFAKFAKNIQSTLLLSGEVLGYRYANNKCINLIGIPDLNYASSTITYKQELFSAKYFDFVVRSPYKVMATYDLQQTYESIRAVLELSNIIYHLNKDKGTCARIVILNESLDFDENGECKIRAVVGTCTNAVVNIWLYFRNGTFGDFSVKFVSTIKDCTDSELLKVEVPAVMKRTKGGSVELFLYIPIRNSLFINCMKSLLVMLTEGDELELWKRITETEMGINILERLFVKPVDTKTGIRSQCTEGLYNVIVDKSVNVILPETINFEDECRAGFLKIPLLLKNIDEYPRDFFLILESKETCKKRYYTVTFLSQ